MAPDKTSLTLEGASGGDIIGKMSAWAESDLDPSDGRPGQLGRVVRRHPQSGERTLDELSWGLLPPDIADPASLRRPIHARAETVETNSMFADAFRRRRAIVPATEWFQRRTKAGPPSAFTGRWRDYGLGKADWQFTTADVRIRLKRVTQHSERLRLLAAN